MKLPKLFTDKHAAVGVYEIVVVVLGFFLLAILAPVAMHQMQAANYTGVNSAVITVMTVVVPIIFAIGVALKFLPHKG